MAVTLANEFPVYHGDGRDGYGRQHGFFWCQPLQFDLTCTKVELDWKADSLGVQYGTVAFGWHEIPLPAPPSVNYIVDQRIHRDQTRYPFSSGERRTVDLPWFVDVVNRNRADGPGSSFGLVVGADTSDPRLYGKGTAVAVRYFWEKGVGWLR